jgi:hypothetical protein
MPSQKLRPALVAPEALRFTKARDGDQVAEIEALAAKLEPKVARAVLAYLEQVKAGVSLDALIAALQSGDVGKVLALLTGAEASAAAGVALDELNGTVWAGGALAATQVNAQIGGVAFAFNRLNPRLITYLQTYSLNLIRQITDGTREQIRASLISGMEGGKNPIATARDIRGAIGLTEKQAQAVKNYRKELETFHQRRTGGGYNVGAQIDRVNGRQVFRPDADGLPKDGITERRLRDYRYDNKLARAMETRKPIPPAEIDKMVAAYERKFLKHRSQVIARTETLKALNYGVQDGWRQAIEGGKVAESLVRRKWVVGKDERLCETCAPVPGLNPKKGVKFDQPFATPKGPVMLPTLHPQCRCYIVIRVYEPEQLAA